MIIVRVELHSANTGEITELARMHVCNESHLCEQPDPINLGSYGVYVLRGRSTKQLDVSAKNRTFVHAGKFGQFPRLQLHVWNLVLCALVAAGYKGTK
jgi:hypothetical protein